MLLEYPGALLGIGSGLSQIWIGPHGSTPANAPYVPPPPQEMHEALAAWELFLHSRDGAVAIAAHRLRVHGAVTARRFFSSPRGYGPLDFWIGAPLCSPSASLGRVEGSAGSPGLTICVDFEP